MIRSDRIRQPYRCSCTCYKAAFATCLLFGVVGLPLASLGLAKVDRLVFLSRSWSSETPPSIEKAVIESQSPENMEVELLEALRSLNGPDSAVVKSASQQWQVVRMKVTAYCPCPICCGKHADGYTANNHRIRSGDAFVAADKKVPFGTVMIIPGYNGELPVRVMDRGRLIRGNRLDIFMHSHRQAQKWGCRDLDVLVKVE